MKAKRITVVSPRLRLPCVCSLFFQLKISIIGYVRRAYEENHAVLGKLLSLNSRAKL